MHSADFAFVPLCRWWTSHGVPFNESRERERQELYFEPKWAFWKQCERAFWKRREGVALLLRKRVTQRERRETVRARESAELSRLLARSLLMNNLKTVGFRCSKRQVTRPAPQPKASKNSSRWFSTHHQPISCGRQSNLPCGSPSPSTLSRIHSCIALFAKHFKMRPFPHKKGKKITENQMNRKWSKETK